MTTRFAISDTDLTEQNYASGFGVEGANHLAVPVANESFISWVNGVAARSGGSSSLPFGSVDDTNIFIGADIRHASQYSQMAFSHRSVYGASPAATEKISHYIAGTGGAKAKFTHTLTLERRDTGTEDQANASLGSSSTTSSTFATKASATFTPADAGDNEYLVIGEALLQHGSTSSDIECQLTVDGTVFNLMRHRPKSTSAWQPWTCVLGLTTAQSRALDNTSHTIAIEFRSVDNTTTATIQRARLMILRLDTFKKFYYAENSSRARQFTTSATYTTKLTNAPTIANAGDHLVFADSHIDGTTGSGRSTFGQITGGGTTLLESDFFPQSNLGNDDGSLRMFRLENLSAGASATNTWKIEIKKGGTGIGGVGCQHATICVVELEEASASRIVSIGGAFSRTKLAYAG